ncbi:MAG: hypothetical protein KME65_13055 [Candidatus Thiodiazotropha sp. (ex Ctena orbiculata)]|uniref:EamA domain-containing protein n=1 Tax=Candidatus Thiodiazotropha taylori TaxID=2792791 RepID=A0A944M8E5_9GAMM|nr:hypothetical protein [Candidatus Thiodiazotropha taylori]MBV2135676.1 hypothetical protein [Candidatus Thiodiazotropha taylori]
MAILLLVMAILCRSLAFVFAKYAALESIGAGVTGIIVNIFYFAEIMALGFQMLFWMLVLKRLRLNIAYPAMSSVYAINLGWAWYLFDEHVTMLHIVGCIIIMIGIVIASVSQEITPV